MKNIEGWSTTKRVIAVIVILAVTTGLSVAWGSYTDQAFGQPTQSTQSDQSADRVENQERVPVSKWPRRMTRKFVNHRINVSTDRRVGTKMVNRLESYKQSQPRRMHRWWGNSKQGRLNSTECLAQGFLLTMPWPSTSGLPILYCSTVGTRPTAKKINRSITKTWVVCGGHMVIGAGGGLLIGAVTIRNPFGAAAGTVTGAGIEGMRCAWERYGDTLVDLLDDRRKAGA